MYWVLTKLSPETVISRKKNGSKLAQLKKQTQKWYIDIYKHRSIHPSIGRTYINNKIISCRPTRTLKKWRRRERLKSFRTAASTWTSCWTCPPRSWSKSSRPVLAVVSNVVWLASPWLWSANCANHAKMCRTVKSRPSSRPICVTCWLCPKWLDQLSVFTMARLLIRSKSSQKWSATTWASSRSRTSPSSTVVRVSVPHIRLVSYRWNKLVCWFGKDARHIYCHLFGIINISFSIKLYCVSRISSHLGLPVRLSDGWLFQRGCVQLPVRKLWQRSNIKSGKSNRQSSPVPMDWDCWKRCLAGTWLRTQCWRRSGTTRMRTTWIARQTIESSSCKWLNSGYKQVVPWETKVS